MALLQSIDNARAERIGRDGVAADAYGDTLARSADALAWLRARHEDGSLPLLRLPEKADDIPAIKSAATRLSAGATDFVFLGTGGSSLGGQTVAELAGCGVPGLGAWRDGPRLHFMDNLDADTYASLLARLPLAATRFVAISKSGGTGETLMQAIAALASVRAAGLAGKAHELFFGITEPAVAGRRNGLRDHSCPWPEGRNYTSS